MAIDHVLSSIDTHAAAEIAEIEREGAAQAEGIIQGAHERAEREIERYVAEKVTAEQIESLRRRNAAEMESRRRMAGVRRELFEKAFDLAREKLPALSERSDYRTILMSYIDEALAGLDAPATIHVNARDVDLVPEGYRGCAIVGDQDIAGGAVVVSGDGRITRSNTFEDRLERFHDEAGRQVSEVLYS